jgi:hypothetical protein
MSRFSFSFVGKPKKVDTGLRGTFGGRLYVDKKVFYKRKDIQGIIDGIRKSETIKDEISQSKTSAV